MRVGTYEDGREVIYSETASRFSVGGAVISPSQLLEYDSAGQISWVNVETAAWARNVSLAAITPPPATPAPAAKRSNASGCVALMVIALLVWACLSIFSGTHPSSPAGSTGSLALKSSKWETGEFGNKYVTGEVVNESAKTYSYAQVEINLYDASGAQVGSTLANVNNLAPGATWKFKAPVLEDSATKSQVKEVTGW